MCFNKKVVAGLAIVALLVLIAAPELLGRALPLLFLAACPLSMVLMMRAMGGMGGNSDASGGNSDESPNSSTGSVALGSEATAREERERELEEEVNRLRAEIVQREAGRT